MPPLRRQNMGETMRYLYRLFAEGPGWEGGSTASGKASLTTVFKLILGAAVITAPLYIIGETFDLSHAGRVLLINGGTAGAAIILMLLVQRGYARLVGALTVWVMYALVTSLAATSGEPIHVNVVNFVLVLVLAQLPQLRLGSEVFRWFSRGDKISVSLCSGFAKSEPSVGFSALRSKKRV